MSQNLSGAKALDDKHEGAITPAALEKGMSKLVVSVPAAAVLVAAAAANFRTSDVVAEYMLVPSENVRKFIGKDGCTIKGLKHDGALLALRQDWTGEGDTHRLEACGLVKDVHELWPIVRDKLNLPDCPTFPIDLNELANEKLELRVIGIADTYMHVIGKNQRNLDEMRGIPGMFGGVWVRRKEHADKSSTTSRKPPPDQICLLGTRSAVEKATADIRRHIEKARDYDTNRRRRDEPAHARRARVDKHRSREDVQRRGADRETNRRERRRTYLPVH